MKGDENWETGAARWAHIAAQQRGGAAENATKRQNRSVQMYKRKWSNQPWARRKASLRRPQSRQRATSDNSLSRLSGSDLKIVDEPPATTVSLDSRGATSKSSTSHRRSNPAGLICAVRQRESARSKKQRGNCCWPRASSSAGALQRSTRDGHPDQPHWVRR